MVKETTDDSFQLLGARFFQKQLDALTHQFQGIRENQDIEPVHKARVASRRMRAGFALFRPCFTPKKFKEWRKEIRRLRRRLGAARDRDVAIDFLRDFRKDLAEKGYRPGVNRLLLRLEQERRAVQPKVLKAIDQLDRSPVLDEMYGMVGRILFGLRRHAVEAVSGYTLEQSRGHIRERLEELLSYEESLSRPDDVKQHHGMRIAAKRLRYTLEICRGVWPGELDGIIKAVKAHQTLLGDIHDCDVWVDYLDGFKEAEYRRTVEFYGHAGHYHRLKGGIEYLQENRRQRRRELFEGLNDHWHRLDQDRLWTRLLGLIERVPESPDGAGSEGGGPETPSSGGDSATAAVKTTKTEPEIPLAEGDSSAEDPLASLAAGACSLDVPVEPSSEGEPGLFAGEQASSTGEGDAPPTGTGEEKAS